MDPGLRRGDNRERQRNFFTGSEEEIAFKPDCDGGACAPPFTTLFGAPSICHRAWLDLARYPPLAIRDGTGSFGWIADLRQTRGERLTTRRFQTFPPSSQNGRSDLSRPLSLRVQECLSCTQTALHLSSHAVSGSRGRGVHAHREQLPAKQVELAIEQRKFTEDLAGSSVFARRESAMA